MESDNMNPSKPQEHSYQARTLKSTFQLARWNFAWVATCALMASGPGLLWNKAVVFTLLAVGLNVCVGIGLILVTKNYIMGLDELLRKVHLNALGITVGVAIVFGVPYSVMDTYDLIPFHADISHLVMLMGLTYLVSFLYGTWRYR
jgi:hypothetical protein